MSTIKDLPRKYQAVSGISSVALRYALTDTLHQILGLLPYLESFDRSSWPYQTTLNFFDYLQKSSVTPRLISSRAQWLCQYAWAVRDRLYRARRQLQYRNHSHHEHDSCDLQDCVADIIDTTIALRIKTTLSIDDDARFVGILLDLQHTSKCLSQIDSSAITLELRDYISEVHDDTTACHLSVGVIGAQALRRQMVILRRLSFLINRHNTEHCLS